MRSVDAIPDPTETRGLMALNEGYIAPLIVLHLRREITGRARGAILAEVEACHLRRGDDLCWFRYLRHISTKLLNIEINGTIVPVVCAPLVLTIPLDGGTVRFTLGVAGQFLERPAPAGSGTGIGSLECCPSI
jgi:hypothetical protein